MRDHSWNVEVIDDFFVLLTRSPYITKITTSKEEVEFVRTTRNGILNSPSLINKVRVYDITGNESKTLIKEISFNYTDMSSGPSVDTTTNAYPWHTVLTSVAVGNGSSIEKVYTFDYYAPPNRSYTSPDYWNYYVFGRGYGPEQDLFLPEPIANIPFRSKLSVLTSTLSHIYNSNKYFIDRSPSKQTNAFSLKRIGYPTGGYTEYEYELNESTNNIGNGQRIKRIRSYSAAGADPIATVFTYGRNESEKGISEYDTGDNWLNHSLFRKDISSLYVSRVLCPGNLMFLINIKDEKTALLN